MARVSRRGAGRGSVKSSARKSKTPYAKEKRTSAALKSRAAKVAKKRGVSASTKKVAKLAVNNAKRIKKLADEAYGPIQHNYVSYDPVMVDTLHPVCLCLNNMSPGGENGPKLMTTPFNDSDNDISDEGAVTRYDRTHVPKMYKQGKPFFPYKDRLNWISGQADLNPSGPDTDRVLVLSVGLKIKVTGWTTNTNMDFYILRQKPTKMSQLDPWFRSGDQDFSVPENMPFILNYFCRTNEPGEFNKLDKSKFRVIKHKRIRMNAATVDDNNLFEWIEDLTEFGDQVDYNQVGLTPPYKYCSMGMKVDQKMKPLLRSTIMNNVQFNQTLYQDTNMDYGTHENLAKGAYAYANYKPKDNLWFVCTCSDPGTAIEPNKRIHVEIQKFNRWRDMVDEQNTAR